MFNQVRPNYNASVARYRKGRTGIFVTVGETLCYRETPERELVLIGMTLAEVDEEGHILRCSACTCVWAGSVKFDGWLRRQVGADVLVVIKDGGHKYREYRAQRGLELVEDEAA